MELLTVLGLSAIELWAGVAAGFALGLHPVATGVVVAMGGVFGELIVAWLGEKARAQLVKRHRRSDGSRRPGRMLLIWQRHGLVGLGLLGPLITGAPIAVALGLSFGAPLKRLLLWTTAGIILWAVTLTLVVSLGLTGIETLGS